MPYRNLISTMALTAALAVTAANAWAFDQAKYPDWSGAWRRIPVPGVNGQPGYDPTKRLGPAQQAPLTDEARKIMEVSMADQAKGGQGNYPTYTCRSPGMPRMMTPYGTMELVIIPDTVHILLEHVHDSRRIYTDGRPWPTNVIPTLQGYSIGKWVDTDGDGRYDLLEVETRNMRGPRAFDASGMPLHNDNKTIVKERMYVDKSNPNVWINELTTIDSSLTRPWSVVKRVVRNPKETQPFFEEENCAEGNGHVEIGGQGYFLSAEGDLMPSQKGQKAPDLRYFNQTMR